MPFLFLFLFGLGVGTLSGLLGIGGGVVLAPGLMLLFGFSQPEAQGTSLAVLIPPIGLFAALVYYQNGFVRIPVVGWVAAGFLVGALIGAKFVPVVPLAVLRLAFGGLLLYLGFMFVFSPGAAKPATALPAGLAAVGSVLFARLIRRKIAEKRSQPPAPDDHIEYHL